MDRFRDDPTIADSENLWRRIHPDWVVPDANSGALRLSSAAFDNDSKGGPMSILIESIMLSTARSYEAAIIGFEGYYLAAVTAGQVRTLDQGVAKDPEPDEPAHAVVLGSKTRSVRRRLAKVARWLIPPQGIDRVSVD